MSIIKEAINLIITCDKTMMDILFVTLRMSIASSIISLIIGVMVGVYYGYTNFKFCKILVVINRTLMGMPPVVCGLICFLLFCGVGPFRHFKLLYTVEVMVIAQVLLITPIVIGTMEPFIKKLYPEMKETVEGLHLSSIKKYMLLLNESKYQIISTYMIAFSRAIAEVGAVSMVGGAIVFKTNVMTTAIMQYTNMGNFNFALALGIILILLSFVVNLIAVIFQTINK